MIINKRQSVLSVLSLGLLLASSLASAETHAVFVNDSGQDVNWRNGKYAGTVKPGEAMWTWLPFQFDAPKGLIEVKDTGFRCGGVNQWQISSGSPTGVQNTCVEVRPLNVGCVGVNTSGFLHQISSNHCMNLRLSAYLNVPELEDVYQYVVEELFRVRTRR